MFGFFSETISLFREISQGLSEVTKALRPKPPKLGFSIVITNNKIDYGDYLHIVNVSGRTLYHVKINIKKENHPEIPIQQVYTLSHDAFGDKTRFKIDIPEFGIYFLDHADFVIPLKEIGVFNAGDALELHYEYVDEDGAKKKGDVVYPVRVDIEESEHHIPHKVRKPKLQRSTADIY